MQIHILTNSIVLIRLLMNICNLYYLFVMYMSIGCILTELYTGVLLFGTHQDLEHLALMEAILEKCIPNEMCEKAIQPYRQAKGGKYYRNNNSNTRSRNRDSDSNQNRRRRSISPQHNHSNHHNSKHSHHHHHHHNHHRYSNSSCRSNNSSSLSPSPSPSPRDRSSSTPAADQLLHISTGRLRWPDSATSNNSIERVRRAKSLRHLLRKSSDGQFYHLLQGLLTYDPKRRLTAAQALQHTFFDPVREQFKHLTIQKNNSTQQHNNNNQYKYNINNNNSYSNSNKN